MKRPSVVCQLCTFDEYLEYTPLPDHLWEVTCRNPSHAPWIWSPAPEQKGRMERDGVAEALGLFDTLPDLLPTDGFHDEYGIIEYRLGLARPAEYAELLRMYGHTAQRRGAKYTMSAFLGGILGVLYRAEEVASVWGRATGYWSYNGEVGYYSQLPDPPAHRRRSWEEFAGREGLDPNEWPLVRPG